MTADLSAAVELTVLDPLACPADVEAAILAAQQAGIGQLRVAPTMMSLVAESNLQIGTVAGFPTGKHHALIKATEARFAVQHGAADVLLAPDLGCIASRDFNALLSELIAVREAISDQVSLGLWFDPRPFDSDRVIQTLATVARAGINYVALPEPDTTAVGLVRQQLPAGVGLHVHADSLAADAARALLDAGVTRLSVSRVIEVS